MIISHGYWLILMNLKMKSMEEFLWYRLLVLGQTFSEITRCQTIQMFFHYDRWFSRKSSSTFINRTSIRNGRQCSCTTTYSLEIIFNKSLEYRIGYVRWQHSRKVKGKVNDLILYLFVGWTSRIYEYCCDTRSNSDTSSCSRLSLWFEEAPEFCRSNG